MLKSLKMLWMLISPFTVSPMKNWLRNGWEMIATEQVLIDDQMNIYRGNVYDNVSPLSIGILREWLPNAYIMDTKRLIEPLGQKVLVDMRKYAMLERVCTIALDKLCIGRSEGAFIKFALDDVDETIKVYSTRPDTLFSATFLVIAPEHPIVDKFADRISNIDEVNAYKAECEKKSAFERTELNKDKTGVKLQGMSVINPVNGEKLPIFIADYVMMGYGTGAIMAVPAHDQRDYDFAKKYEIEIRQVILGGDIEKEAYAGDGKMINSGFLNGYTNKKDSIKRMIDELEKMGVGEKAVQYKMQEWAFNRQRYWGGPIPIVHCEHCALIVTAIM